MDTLLMLLAVCGLAFAVSHVEGPFGVISRIRSLLGRIPVVGSMLLDMFECNFCSGVWSGVAVYVGTGGSLLNWTDMGVFALASGVVNMVVSKHLETVISTSVSSDDTAAPNQ